MPLQNRVLPTGEIVAIAARGTRMGNRGRIHVDGQRLGPRRWESRRPWIICRLDYHGNNRIQKYGQLMSARSYTELFFLDEVTALAAGHRPCGECSKDRYQAFQRGWAQGVLEQPGLRVSATAIDTALHADRVDEAGRQRRFEALIGDLPDGVMIMKPGKDGDVWLLWKGRLLRYTPPGYEAGYEAARDEIVTVLTPEPTVRVLAEGYVPQVHASAR